MKKTGTSTRRTSTPQHMKKILISILALLAINSQAQQQRTITLDQAIEEALQNNGSIKASQYHLDARKQLQKASFDLPKTDVNLQYGQYNSYANDNNITITQTIPFSAFGSQGALNRALATSATLQKSVSENEIIFQVKQVYFQLAFAKARRLLLLRQDSIYEGFMKSASLRYRTGETYLLEQTTAQSQRNEVTMQLQQNETEIFRLQSQLKTLTQAQDMADISISELTPIPFDDEPDTTSYKENPAIALANQQVEVGHREKKFQAAKAAPDLHIGFFSQTLTGAIDLETGRLANGTERFTGVTVGLSIPLWYAPHGARVRSAELTRRASESNLNYYEQSLQNQLQQSSQMLQAHRNNLNYYLNSSLPNADLILKQAQVAFQQGEIGYPEYLLGIRNAVGIKENYLKTLNDYNQNVIYIQYLTGKK
jgi:heavy metal efflux system protein